MPSAVGSTCPFVPFEPDLVKERMNDGWDSNKMSKQIFVNIISVWAASSVLIDLSGMFLPMRINWAACCSGLFTTEIWLSVWGNDKAILVQLVNVIFVFNFNPPAVGLWANKSCLHTWAGIINGFVEYLLTSVLITESFNLNPQKYDSWHYS